ncbi:ATP-dependent DNA helicase DinG [Alteribacter populi]|uniref:ATP-dependent DNA helicase DinG n=1 Tax=Alteribacter populi TaxID=2011011 RepID=UPI000BBB3FFD|nr:ATP-dependent DNA helicase DinG [Alteribacter populi]
MKRFVILDVETTGVSYKKGDRIIQMAFVVMEGNEVKDRFTTYLNPGQPIPSFIKSLTKINDQMVEEAPFFSEVAPTLLRHLDGAFFVAHNVNFDLRFINEELEAAGYEPFEGPVLDTVELARMVYPTADGFRLTQLSEEFDLDHTKPHRADSDAEVTAKLLTDLFAAFKQLPLVTLQQIKRLAHTLSSDLMSLLNEWIAEKIQYNNQEDRQIDIYRGFALKAIPSIQEKTVETELQGDRFNEFIENVFKNKTEMERAITGYEDRTGQVDMMEAVFEAFKTRQHGLIEAGTGTGKSLAYLIPAAFTANQSKKPVVISTYTIQLQEQLLKKDVPILQSLIPFSCNVALIKGREHYISLQKFEAVLEHDPYENYDRNLSKVQVLVWLTQTETGDVEELNLAAGAKRFWSDICANREDEGSHTWYPRCFYHRARQRARTADLIITNHALVLSDLHGEGGLLPSYKRMVIDEGHHFERAASHQLGERIDYVSFSQLLNEVGTVDGNGLLSNISRTAMDDKQITQQIDDVELIIKNTKAEVSELFLFLHHWANKHKRKRNERGKISVTYDPRSEEWQQVKEAASRCVFSCNDSLHNLIKLAEKMEYYENHHNIPENQRNRFNSSFRSLTMMIDQLHEAKDTLKDLFLHWEENKVYWLEAESRGPKHIVSLQARPIDVSAILADDLFTKKDSVILTSATLTVNQRFDYVIENLGLEDFALTTLMVNSPFSWKDQVKLMIPNDIPLLNKVDDRTYIEAVVLHLYRLAQVSEGRMLVLFTSYDMLRQCHELLKELLDEEYMLISQGIHSGSRTKLTKSFQQFQKAIMLGTSSFWEGVDIPGEDLSLLVMARLPFTPPDDPIYKAKASLLESEGKSSFMELAIPQAVIRFKQGFGRLIRKKSDKGAVVILDRRIHTTRYGKMFIKSLPDLDIVEAPIEGLEAELKDWL